MNTAAATQPTQRLFFACWPSPEFARALAEIGASLAGDRARVIAPADIHLTLAFAGNCTAAQRDCLIAAADRYRGAPFDLAITRLGWWARPRVVWAAPAETPAALHMLAETMAAALDACALALDDRPYQPHLTLIRGAATAPDLDSHGSWIWNVTRFGLYESAPQRSGTRYRCLADWPIAPATA
ncbi:MAG: RNA 2',3'-cyclic phosphodiesterase [Chromatiales bacterium]|nr:RNA 2',3'-cyclic phosphodiesterase [Chromatiales bacterium]